MSARSASVNLHARRSERAKPMQLFRNGCNDCATVLTSNTDSRKARIGITLNRAPGIRPDVKQILALTAGEPAGIGPDLCVQIAQMDLPYNLVVVADRELL